MRNSPPPHFGFSFSHKQFSKSVFAAFKLNVLEEETRRKDCFAASLLALARYIKTFDVSIMSVIDSIGQHQCHFPCCDHSSHFLSAEICHMVCGQTMGTGHHVMKYAYLKSSSSSSQCLQPTMLFLGN